MLPVNQSCLEEDHSQHFADLKKSLEIFRKFVSSLRDAEEVELALASNPDLPHFVESMLKLFLLFKWPPWEKYNRNPQMKDEFERRKAQRSRFVHFFFDGHGVELSLELIQLVKHDEIVRLRHCILFSSLVYLFLWLVTSRRHS